MRLLFLFSIVCLSTTTWSQGIEIAPLTRNFELKPERPIQKSTSHSIDSSFFYTPDTLSLPFFDEFSTNKFQKYNAQFNDPGVSSTVYFHLLDPGTLTALDPAATFTEQETFRRTFDISTSTFTDSIFASTSVKVADFSSFPLSYQTLNLYPPYYIYDTIGVPDTPDTVWVQNPSFIQDSVRIFFATLNDPFAIWLDDHAYLNRRFGVSPRSLGVVTFDGLNANGYPYAIGTSLTNTADYLHSKPLDLSPYTAADSIYFSFLFQAEGWGDTPEATDSLRLEFYAKELDQWIQVWSAAGDSTTPFKVVHLPVLAAKYFKKGFQFRFSNYGALSGALDHFHIDYVHLRAQSNLADTLFKDFAWVYPLNSILPDYTSVPWDHYKNTPKAFRNDFPIALHNGSTTPENNQIAGQFAIDYVGNQINRGGDITYHGPGQLVMYPILDLEQFFTDIHQYLRYLEEAVIRTLAHFQISATRFEGLTGVWIDADTPHARKICAMGVKCSRWITMHGIALNVSPDLGYFGNIVPCGIQDKAVTSMAKELGREVSNLEVQEVLLREMSAVFNFSIQEK